jgi:selenocysteine lyase/cysteine desulfurase
MPVDEAYCNTGTIGASPIRVINAMYKHVLITNTNAAHINWHEGGQALLSGYGPYVEIREKLGKLINTTYTNIALIQNATMGMNLLSNGLEIPKDAEILTTDIEHPGGKSGWELHSKRHGSKHIQVKIPHNIDGPAEILAAFEQAITPNTTLMSFPHISSAHGIVFPAEELSKLAAEHDVFSVVDGAQTPGHIKIDVERIGCDAYYGSPHKWLMAPAGNGFLYINPKRADEVWTTLASSQWDNHTDNGYRLGQRGTGNPSLLIGLEEALDFHYEIGPDRVYTRIKELGDRLRQELHELPHVEVVTPLDIAAGLTTFKVKDVEGEEVQRRLWERGKIQPRALSEGNVRYSTHIYNNEDEVDRSIAIIKNL